MSRLALRGVRKSFGPVVALDGLDLDVPAGSRTAIVGPSGCGKTTVLRIVAGFETPDAGTVSLDGEVLADTSVSRPAHLRGIGIVTQDGALFPHLSVGENVGFGVPARGRARHAAVAELMELVGLPLSMLDQSPDELSGGQQQRVALARALAQSPRLMLLDEPFSALDTGLRAATRRAVADLLGSKGITTVLVTHDQTEALSFADRVAMMQDGRLRQVGTPRDLYFRPRDAGVATFFGDAVLLPAEIADDVAVCALGHLPIEGACRRSGNAQVMLRPEQLRIVKAAEAGRGSDDIPVRGDVLEVTFGGPDSTVLVRLPRRPEVAPVRARITGDQEIAVGDVVGIAVTGTAHVMPDGDPPHRP